MHIHSPGRLRARAKSPDGDSSDGIGGGGSLAGGERLKNKNITTNSTAGFLLTAIDDYIFLFRMMFGIYSVNSLEGFFTVAVLLVVFIYFSPAAS